MPSYVLSTPQHLAQGRSEKQQTNHPQEFCLPLPVYCLIRTDSWQLFGIPTRYGNYSAQWKTFIDHLGQLWQQGALWGKYYGLFISTATAGGGQESTALAAISSWAHQGMVYVSLGYAKAFPLLADLSEARGGSPWGAGTFAGGDGSRQPSAKELELAEIQGAAFWETVSKVNF